MGYNTYLIIGHSVKMNSYSHVQHQLENEDQKWLTSMMGLVEVESHKYVLMHIE